MCVTACYSCRDVHTCICLLCFDSFLLTQFSRVGLFGIHPVFNHDLGPRVYLRELQESNVWNHFDVALNGIMEKR